MEEGECIRGAEEKPANSWLLQHFCAVALILNPLCTSLPAFSVRPYTFFDSISPLFSVHPHLKVYSYGVFLTYVVVVVVECFLFNLFCTFDWLHSTVEF